ncbi:MAG: hypothetical protein LBM27_05795 [Lactobacillaceae bacterium]|jgi:hypothetical protein|nr:hypothetical protein [Lactobacillaceae bacterium]
MAKSKKQYNGISRDELTKLIHKSGVQMQNDYKKSTKGYLAVAITLLVSAIFLMVVVTITQVNTTWGYLEGYFIIFVSAYFFRNYIILYKIGHQDQRTFENEILNTVSKSLRNGEENGYTASGTTLTIPIVNPKKPNKKTAASINHSKSISYPAQDFTLYLGKYRMANRGIGLHLTPLFYVLTTEGQENLF